MFLCCAVCLWDMEFWCCGLLGKLGQLAVYSDVLFELGAVTDSGTRAPSLLTARRDTLLSQWN